MKSSAATLDQQFVWHPFTQMRDWLAQPPVVIVRGRATRLWDDSGRSYLDANASIWTNLHGHRHPALDAALRHQLNRVAHSSALGLANEPASFLAADLIRLANPPLLPPLPPPTHSSPPPPPPLNLRTHPAPPSPPHPLAKVFYSDDGSTALETALKMAWEFTRRTRGLRHPRFLSLQGAYHGDTVGAVSLGHIDRFHAAFGGLLFPTESVMAPYCYRCPHNRAQPDRVDARRSRRCRWECLDHLQRAFTSARRQRRPITAFVVEPRLQGAAGMIPQPDGWLRFAATIARHHGALLIADEVLTGFGRTGHGPGPDPLLFASHHEGVQPDFLCLAKGLSGGYLPIAATLTTLPVFNAFLGRYEEFKTFFHGHSYTANPLGAAVSRASLALLEAPQGIARRQRLESLLAQALQPLWDLPAVGDIRQVGLVAAIELVRDWTRRTPFPARLRIGHRVTEAMRRRGVLTRPVGDVIVLMPPYCTSPAELRRMIQTLAEAVQEILPGPPRHRPTPRPSPAPH